MRLECRANEIAHRSELHVLFTCRFDRDALADMIDLERGVAFVQLLDDGLSLYSHYLVL